MRRCDKTDHLDERDLEMLARRYKQAEDRGRPQPPDPTHEDACPVLAFRDPFINEMLALWGPYSDHGTLYRAPAVLSEQPNRYVEAMRIISSAAGDRQRANNGDS